MSKLYRPPSPARRSSRSRAATTRRSLSASSGQWLPQRLAPARPRTASPSPRASPGSPDAEALERAGARSSAGAEAPRTVIVGADGVPAQRVFPFAGFRLPVHDLTAMHAAGRGRGGGAARAG